MTAIIHNGIRCYPAPDGNGYYPSVSACLDELYPSGGVWVDQAAMDRGTACHKWMEQWLYARSLDLPIDPMIRDRVVRASAWVTKEAIITLAAEKTVFD